MALVWPGLVFRVFNCVVVSGKVAGPTPSTVTPIVALPAPMTVISPALDIVATAVALLVHTTLRPVSDRTLFAASRATAVA